MLVVEVSGLMKTVARQRTRIDTLDEGEWLYRLLADIHEEIASHPSRQAIERIRDRLLTQIEAPAKAAA